MMSKDQDNQKSLLGRAERLDFPELAINDVPARIDTGAKTSSVWASEVTLADGVLQVVLFGKGSDLYTGTILTFAEFDTTVVASSNGHAQERFKVQLLVKLKGRRVRAWFTLADRSTQVYPVLIGRNILLGKFVVDVKHGHIAKDAERKRSETLQKGSEEEE